MTTHEDRVRQHTEALQAFNERDMDTQTSLYAEDVVSTDHAQQQTMRGVDDIRAWNQAWQEAFPDGRIEDIECFGADEWTVARFTGRGTNDGPLAGFEPTNRQVEVDFCNVGRWEGGQVVEEHTYYDLYGMLSQLGHVPPLRASA